MREIFQALRDRQKYITVVNGEYLKLVADISDLKASSSLIAAAITDIAAGQKILGEQQLSLLDRVSSLESRLPS